jgi:hypothetical protein
MMGGTLWHSGTCADDSEGGPSAREPYALASDRVGHRAMLNNGVWIACRLPSDRLAQRGLGWVNRSSSCPVFFGCPTLASAAHRNRRLALISIDLGASRSIWGRVELPNGKEKYPSGWVTGTIA